MPSSDDAGWPDDRFRALLGSRHPILLAPMAGAGGVELAVAAMKGGAAGALPCAMLAPDAVHEQVAEVRTATKGPLNLNFFCHTMPDDADDKAWRKLLQGSYPAFAAAEAEGDRIAIGDRTGRVIDVPGHTLGHIALIFEDERVAFVGDTLFAMGCGRLFEGTPEQMYESLQRLTALPDQTLLYCAHEYTLSNARYAAHAEPGNAATAQRLATVQRLREAGEITLPTTVAEERATNPFVRAANVDEFARRRAEKDSFR